jgi:hypothetical protein
MYGSLMNEEIFAAVVRGDKPETLVAVEPFHNPGLLGNNRSCIFRHRRDGKTPTEEEPPLKPVLSPQPTSAGPQNFLVALFSAFVSLSLSLSLFRALTSTTRISEFGTPPRSDRKRSCSSQDAKRLFF